jgi:hypothetical protein
VTVHWPSIDALVDSLPEFGPLAGAVAALRAGGRWDAARAALAQMLTAEAVSTDGELVLEVPYALTVAERLAGGSPW